MPQTRRDPASGSHILLRAKEAWAKWSEGLVSSVLMLWVLLTSTWPRPHDGPGWSKPRAQGLCIHCLVRGVGKSAGQGHRLWGTWAAPRPRGGLTGRWGGGSWISTEPKGQQQSHSGVQQSWGPVGLASRPALDSWDHLSWPRFPHPQHKA